MMLLTLFFAALFLARKTHSRERHKRIFPLSLCLLLRNPTLAVWQKKKNENAKRKRNETFKFIVDENWLCCGGVRESETWNCFYLKRLSDIREHHQRLNCCFAAFGGGDFSLSFDYSSFSWYSFSDHEKKKYIRENKKEQ